MAQPYRARRAISRQVIQPARSVALVEFFRKVQKESQVCELTVETSAEGTVALHGTIRKQQDGQDQFSSRYDVVFDRHGNVTHPCNSTAGLSDVPEVRLIDPHAPLLRAQLHQLYTRVVEKGLRSQALSILTAITPDVTDIQILAPADVPMLYFFYGDRAVPAALAGDGLRLFLHISLELATRRGGLVLMEEPEVHKHPGAIRQCAQVIIAAVRRGVQIVLTTHSLEMIDALLWACTDEDLERFSVYRLRLEDGVLKHFRSHGREIAFARATIEEDLR